MSVGASAATRKARWALLLAIACITVPKGVSEIIWGRDAYALDVVQAVEDLLAALFEGGWVDYGVVAALALLVWGSLGAVVTSARVRREMTP